MSLERVADMVSQAMADRYAIGYFESWNLESLQGVIDAAEETRSPILIGFNGEFLSGPERLAPERIALYASLGQAAAAASSVPCGLVFNECPNDEWIRQAIDAGFGQVMLDDAHANAHDLLRRVTAITEYAHSKGSASEAEVGELPFGAVDHQADMTCPHEAAEFVQRTGIDILGVSVGNVHVMAGNRQKLDLEHLHGIRKEVNVPFDLHGGTGIEFDSLRQAIALGVAKVSYGTYIKQRYLAAVRKALDAADTASNPHELLGMGGSADVLVAGRLAVRDAVLERIHLLGCCGKA